MVRSRINKIVYIFGVVSIVACNQCSKNSVSETDGKLEEISIEISRFDIDGTWALTNYFDTIIENRELAKNRLQDPTWFAVLLEIDGDSLKNFGSIERGDYLLKRTSDTIANLISNVSGDKWFLIVDEPELRLIQYSDSKRIDSTVYTFRKRDELNYFTKENLDFFIIGNNVTDFFNKHLFEGEYIDKKLETKVVFEKNGQLSGVIGFDSYEVRNYFGTLHMHNNLDVITFRNKKNNSYKEYNWVFSDNELVLTEFVPEMVLYDGKTYDGENLILGKKKITLQYIE